MKETGRVIEINGNMAKVEVAQKEVCGKCPSESFCRTATGGSRQIEAINRAGAKPGDTVEIEIRSGIIFAGAFLVYIVPVAALLVTGGLTQWFGGSQNLAIAVGISALGFSFFLIWVLGRKPGYFRKFIPVVKEVVK